MKIEKILLVQPKRSITTGLGSITSNLAMTDKTMPIKAALAPTSLTAIAGLTPPGIDLEIWDEHTRGPVDENIKDEYDLIGITGFKIHYPRAVQIATFFRKKGIFCVVGGPGVSSEPQNYRGKFDCIFIGEAELTWPQFISDIRSDVAKDEYRQIEKPDLTGSPLPRWDLIPNLSTDYGMVPVQTTRGCPFDCDFCDVIFLFGRKPRHRRIDAIIEEIIQLEKMGVRLIFFSDDNFIGQPSFAKTLLRQLIPVNNSFHKPLTFMTQLTINVARDEELLKLLADANIYKVLIGIESANPESLREANKFQNLKRNMLDDFRKIHSFGITIHGQIILGFDNDGSDIFDATFNFIQQSAVPAIAMNMLSAYPGTRLYSRLRSEGRVLFMEPNDEHSTYVIPNIVFKKMSRAEMMRGYLELYKRLYSMDNYQKRIEDMLKQVKYTPLVQKGSIFNIWRERKRLYSMLKFILIPSNKELRRSIIKNIRLARKYAPFMAPRVIQLVVLRFLMIGFIHDMGNDFDKVINNELEHPPSVIKDSIWDLLPGSFHNDFPQLMLSVRQRLLFGLKNQPHMVDALSDVFIDFLESFYVDYDHLGKQKYSLLQDICDRTIARFNQTDPAFSLLQEAPQVGPATAFPACDDSVDKLLIQDVFAAIEKRLVMVTTN